MNIDLSFQEARLLDTHLVREIKHVENELVHTDKHDLQRALADELSALRTIRDRIAAQIAGQRA